jgi:D-alanyl-D-alanine carboxypeptidase (penicillin-binding protein 5/6)
MPVLFTLVPRYHVPSIKDFILSRHALAACFLWCAANLSHAVIEKIEAKNIRASAFIVIDHNSGDIITAKAPDDKVSPAGLTKLMTASLVFDAINAGKVSPSDFVTVSETVINTQGTRTYLSKNKPVSIDELLMGMLVQSGNDAAVALAERLSGSESRFVDLMNERAEALGLTNTHFMNATGWPHPNQYTTANDMLTLAKHIIDNQAKFMPYFRIKSFEYNHITQINKNLLLFRDPFTEGLKTGFAPNEGYNLVNTSFRNGQRITLVLFGSPNEEIRAVTSSQLIGLAFKNTDSPQLYDKNQIIAQLPVYRSHRQILPVVVNESVFINIPKGTLSDLQQTLVYQQPLIAPIKAGELVGHIEIKYQDTLLKTVPVFAQKSISKANFIHNFFENIRLAFEQKDA